MKTYMLKTWRDVMSRKGQFAALIVLVSLGISSYVAFVEAYRNLQASADLAYERLVFEDFDVSVLGAPSSVVQRVEALPGVAAAEGRLIVDTGMEVDAGERGTVRVVGVPVDRRPDVNDLLLEQGRYVRNGDGLVGMLHSKFAAETGRGPGDFLTVRTDDRRHPVGIVGVVASPEYMFPVRAKSEMPSVRGFTILFMAQREAERLFGRPNTITDVAVRVARGSDRERVIDAVEDELEPYRIVATTRREDQPSNFSLSEEMQQNRTMASIMPTLILIISTLSLAIALSRLVQSQRGEIGLAKALGYGDTAVLAHYLLFALVVAAAGSLVGFVLGHMLSAFITGEYTSLLGVPYLSTRVYADVVLSAIGISVAACVVAGLVPAWTSARMTPARAMHADPNLAMRGGRVPMVERLLSPVLPRSFVVRVPLRNVFRARRRSLYTVVGIAFAVLLTLATVAFFDSIEWLLAHQFTDVERWDVSAYFERPMGEGHLNDIARWQGVERVQGGLVVPAKLTANGVTHEGALTAISPSADFHGFDVEDGDAPPEALRRGGLLMPRVLARKLRAGVGDTIAVKTPYRDERFSLRVDTITDESLGTPVYIGIDRGTELAGESRRVYNALYLDVEARKVKEIEERLHDLPAASQVTVKRTMRAMLEEMMSFMYFFFGVLLAFGFTMAFVVIYNTFTANVLERTREIATMRTIGEDGAHLAVMITIENLLLAAVGVPLGVWMGLRTADAVLAEMSSEAFSMRIVVRPETYVWVIAAAFVVLLLSEIPPVRRIFRLDLAEATKVME